MKNHLLLEEPIGTVVTTNVHVFQTQCSAQFMGAVDPISASKIWEEKAKHGVKSNNGKNRNDIASQSMTLNGTCVLVTCLVKYSKSYKVSCRRLGTNLRVFQTGSSSRAC